MIISGMQKLRPNIHQPNLLTKKLQLINLPRQPNPPSSRLSAVVVDRSEGISVMEFDLDAAYVVDVCNDGAAAAVGTQLFEVFAVKLNIKSEIYGTIHVKDSKRGLSYYNRHPEDIESTNQDGSLSLSGPHRPSSTAGRIEISLDLKAKNGDELVKGSFSLGPLLLDEQEHNNANANAEDLIHILFDKYQCKQVEGKSATASIYYTLPRVAAQAEFTLKFVNGNGTGYDGVDVYGTIIARYGETYDTCATDDVKQHCSFLLFHKALEDKVQVKYNEGVPLLRSCVVMPLFTYVVMQLNLEIIHPDGVKEQLKDYNVEFKDTGDRGETKTLPLKQGSMVLKLCLWHSFGTLGTFGPAID